MIAFLLLSAASADPDIVITASRVPEDKAQSAASATTLDKETIERLGEPLAASLLRLAPSVSLESGGPAGTLTQVRIRGAEASHSLLFIDGIRANDPAAGDLPRFELLNADVVSRIEVIRGPQSALWGSDAIGGVVAVNGLDPERDSRSVAAEAGSFGFRRGSASATSRSDRTSLAAAVGWQGADGIDSFGGGDKDGYRNLSTRLRGSFALAPAVQLGAAGFTSSGRSEFDGIDPFTFRRADTSDRTRNRLAAGRLWLTAGSTDTGLSGTVGTALLGSANRNFLDGDEINRTSGTRWSTSAQGQYRFATGSVHHLAVIALDHDSERFRARDTIYFGASNQHRRRTHQALTAEWRAETQIIVADVAMRRDIFSSFKNATTVRASALVELGSGFSVAGSYSEGIAQPSFFDLHGFFPGSFVGNPELEPERSRGFELSARYRNGPLAASLTAYRQTLRDEIVDIFDPSTFQATTANRDTSSKRAGIEAEGSWSLGESHRLSAFYAFLDASEPGAVPARQIREIRRPKHSGLIAADGKAGRWNYGASIAVVGARTDRDFDLFPAQAVRLKPYVLAGARAGIEVGGEVELFARVSNIFDARYQDVFGYRTEGRGLFAGVRLGGRRSSP